MATNKASRDRGDHSGVNIGLITQGTGGARGSVVRATNAVRRGAARRDNSHVAARRRDDSHVVARRSVTTRSSTYAEAATRVVGHVVASETVAARGSAASERATGSCVARMIADRAARARCGVGGGGVAAMTYASVVARGSVVARLAVAACGRTDPPTDMERSTARRAVVARVVARRSPRVSALAESVRGEDNGTSVAPALPALRLVHL